jgi:cell division protease FtsH
MVCRWGMSEALGPQAYAVGDGSFLGEEASLRFMMSNDTTSLIDREIKGLLSACYKRAVEILKRERLFLNALSDILYQVETVDAEEFEIIYQCSVTKKAEAEGLVEKVSECSVCPAKGHCLQFNAN